MSHPRYRKPLAMLTAILIATMALTALAPSTTLAQEDPPVEVEFIGPLTPGETGFIIVNGQTVDISGAEIYPGVTLAAGEVVKVEAYIIDGAFVAREIQLPDDDDVMPGEIELEGVIDSINGTTYTIGNFSFEVTSLAEIEDGVMAGEYVKVHFMVDDEGNWVVREVKLDEADDSSDDMDDDSSDDASSNDDLEDGEDFHMRGTLDEVGDGFIVISGQQFDLNDLTKIEGALVVGASVKIEVRLVDGVFVLEEVDLAGHDHDEDSNEDDDESDDDSDDSVDDSDDDGDDSSDDNSEDDNRDDDGSSSSDSSGDDSDYTVDDSDDDSDDSSDDEHDDSDDDSDDDNSGSNVGSSSSSGSSDDSSDDNSGSSQVDSSDDSSDDDEHDDHDDHDDHDEEDDD